MKHYSEKFTRMRNYIVEFNTTTGIRIKTNIIAESSFHACALVNHKFFKQQPKRSEYSARLTKS